MSTYERKMMEHLKDMEKRRRADIDRIGKLIETKYKENWINLLNFGDN
jgi:hypothetical protein